MKLQEEPNKFYRWNLKNKTPVIKVRLEKGGVSFYGALSYKTKKVIPYLSESKRQNSKETIKYLNQIKQIYHNKGKILLIWDGASHHRSEEIKRWLDDNPDCIELVRFPTYSPLLNPQEKVWKALRKDLSHLISDYSFSKVVDRACRFLKTETCDFDFFDLQHV